MKKIIISFVVTLFFILPAAYAFELEDFEGAPVNLDDKIGNDKWTLVMFWAHDCSICRSEFPAISDFDDARDDVDVVGISIDGEEKKYLAEQFLASTNPSFPSYITSLTLAAFNYLELTEEEFRGTPSFLLFTPEGKLMGSNPGRLTIEALENFIKVNS